GLILEGTGSLVLDRIHRIAYAIESPRTSKVLVELWCEKMGYTPVVFNAYDKNGIAEYHTNVNLFIGSKIAGVCLDKIPENQRQRVLESLSKHHEVLLLTEEQITHYCGNALEVCLPDRAHALVLSHDAFSHLTEMQKNTLSKYYKAFITPDLSVIEKYGGGSARCMLLELF
ncbi:MAG: hypothetical protein JW812_01965, partial [Alphaproteobacteria bacterium]|nr:hypothetical protein [Alphaproteobacteria bacterium]